MLIDEIKTNVLYMLYESHVNVFNTYDTPISERIIGDAFDNDTEKVRAALDELRDAKLIEEVEHAHRLFYRITGRGMEEYEQKYAPA